MSKQPAASQAGGERPSRARATNPAPSRVAWEITSEVHSAHGPDQPPGHGGAEGATPAKRPPPKPAYVRPFQSRQEQPHATPSQPAVGQPPSPYGSAPEGRSGPPPRGRRPTLTAAPTEGVSTPKEEDGTEPARGHARSRIFTSNGPKREPIAFCFTACCIVFWLLVIAVGVAVLVVYLIYRPQPPRLRVTSATLNAGYIDEFGGSGMALNSDLTVLANISNPNTKIDIVLHYMQLDLYFRGSLIGTQAVWPAPLLEGPGGNVLRSVHLVVSEVTMSQEDVMLWRNATAKGEPVRLQLFGRFHTQLNFGRWLPYKYWVYPRCTLWLDPPPSGALRRARC